MDVRQFIDLLSREGLLRRVSRTVDWECEIGEIGRNSQVPLLFENIKDYPGQRLFTNGLSSLSAIGLALGLGLHSNREAIIAELRKRAGVPVRPLLVERGPVLDNVLSGPSLDFLKLPVPRWSAKDGGRYIGTWHINVSRDPETGSRNLGIYRMQVLGPHQATVSASTNSHLSVHLAKAEKRGQPLEMAVAIGTSEAVIMAAAASYPCGCDEYELAGGLQGDNVRLLRCQTVELEVPADSEIVVEGLIQPGIRVQDGPYFDYAGKANTNRTAYLFEATRMMFRNGPIFRGSAIGRPGAEDQQLFSVLSDLNLFDFHGSRTRRMVQKHLIRKGFFKTFQLAGRI